MIIDFQDVKMLQIVNESGEVICDITQDEITPHAGYLVKLIPSDREEERC